MNDEMFRLSLIDITNMGLLNGFVNEVFLYNLKSDDYIYIQYKLINKSVVLNIFDNNDNNRFKAYVFYFGKAYSDNDSFYINVSDRYDEYKKGKVISKVDLIGALLYCKSDDEKKEIIDSLFDNDKIRSVFLKHFIL